MSEFGLDKSARLAAQRQAEAASDRRDFEAETQLNPPFPFTFIPFPFEFFEMPAHPAAVDSEQ